MDSFASPSRSPRLTPLCVVVVALSGLGALCHVQCAGTAPLPCATPAVNHDVLVCDGHGQPPGARAWLVGHKLDVNHARRHELELVPGIGPSLARAIIDTRNAHGAFATTDALDDVPGVGPKTLVKLARFVTVPAENAVARAGSTPERNQSARPASDRRDDVTP